MRVPIPIQCFDKESTTLTTYMANHWKSQRQTSLLDLLLHIAKLSLLVRKNASNLSQMEFHIEALDKKWYVYNWEYEVDTTSLRK